LIPLATWVFYKKWKKGSINQPFKWGNSLVLSITNLTVIKRRYENEKFYVLRGISGYWLRLAPIRNLISIILERLPTLLFCIQTDEALTETLSI